MVGQPSEPTIQKRSIPIKQVFNDHFDKVLQRYRHQINSCTLSQYCWGRGATLSPPQRLLKRWLNVHRVLNFHLLAKLGKEILKLKLKMCLLFSVITPARLTAKYNHMLTKKGLESSRGLLSLQQNFFDQTSKECCIIVDSPSPKERCICITSSN